MQKETKAKMLTLTALRERGWTASMVKAILGEPDLLKKNPMYAKASLMKLYLESRVLEAEESSAFAEMKERSAPRRAASRKAVETKREALLRQVAEMKVSVEVISAAEVRRQAIEAYERWNEDRDHVRPDADRSFIDRISVNYVRHHLTIYDEALEEVAGRVGIADAATMIRQKVYGAIANAYPYLTAECTRQMERRGIAIQVDR